MENPILKRQDSPRGSYRLWRVALIAIAVVSLISYTGELHLDNGELNLNGWAFKFVVIIGKMALGLFGVYYAGRQIIPKRMHELDEAAQLTRSNWILIAIAIVMAAALR